MRAEADGQVELADRRLHDRVVDGRIGAGPDEGTVARHSAVALLDEDRASVRTARHLREVDGCARLVVADLHGVEDPFGAPRVLDGAVPGVVRPGTGTVVPRARR